LTGVVLKLAARVFENRFKVLIFRQTRGHQVAPW
jgi:hypothetical protein